MYGDSIEIKLVDNGFILLHATVEKVQKPVYDKKGAFVHYVDKDETTYHQEVFNNVEAMCGRIKKLVIKYAV